MSQFIIEMGSGNTCRNDIGIVREMIDAVDGADSGKHEVVLKWQLFEFASPNLPLEWSTFAYAYGYAAELGYHTTASVFDSESLYFLERFRVPFVKIANRPRLYQMRHETRLPCVISNDALTGYAIANATMLACVSKYPAEKLDYVFAASRDPGIPKAWMYAVALPEWADGISDHTVGWDLYNRVRPAIIEKHFVLEHDESNPDGGPFAVTPYQLAEVL